MGVGKSKVVMQAGQRLHEGETTQWVKSLHEAGVILPAFLAANDPPQGLTKEELVTDIAV